MEWLSGRAHPCDGLKPIISEATIPGNDVDA